MNAPHPSIATFQHLFGHALDPMWLIVNGELIDCNDAALVVLGYRSRTEILPTPFAALSPKDQPNGDSSESKAASLISQALTDGPQRFEWVSSRSDGSPLWTEATLTLFVGADPNQNVLYMHWRDITGSKQTEERLHYESTHDALTGLPNRRALELELRRAIKRAESNGRSLAVGMIDLDGFKSVNDDLGHDAGDALLKAYSARMQRRLRRHDFIARLGGDEFVVLLNNLDPDNPLTDIETINDRLKEATAQAFQPIIGRKVGIGMSMGIAIYPHDGEEADGLLRLADHALLAIKAIKMERSTWWALANAASAEPEPEEISLEPYGKQASTLLTDATLHILDIQAGINNQQSTNLEEASYSQKVKSYFTPLETEEFKRFQMGRFQRLVKPDLDIEQHQLEAQQLGRLHDLLGLEGFEMISALDRYSSMLQPLIKILPWRFNARLAVCGIIQGRLVQELQGNQLGRTTAEKDRQRVLVLLESLIPAWAGSSDRMETLMQYLSEIDSIVAVTSGRPTIKGDYLIECQRGRHLDVLPVLTEFEGPTKIRTSAKSSVRSRAWRSGRIESCANVKSDEADTQLLDGLGMPRSIAAIPVLDKNGYPSRVLTLYGAYPGQFESPSMRFWLESLRHLVTDLLEYRTSNTNARLTDWEHRQHIHSLLAQDKLRFAVQPLVDLGSGKVDKVEFLARMVDGERLISPAEFLPTFGPLELELLFEESLRTALAWKNKWAELGLPDLLISLNLPIGVLASDQFSQRLGQTLKSAGVPTDQVYLELLETQDDAILEHTRNHVVEELIELGVRLVMDDLGSGFSSLSRLRNIPFDTVKIDQNLVKDAAQDPYKSVQFIKALIQMAHGLGQRVVVEGLESVDLVEMAACLGAERGQGYAIAKPMPPEEFFEWQKNWEWTIDAAWPATPLGLLTASMDGAEVKPVRGRGLAF